MITVKPTVRLTYETIIIAFKRVQNLIESEAFMLLFLKQDLSKEKKRMKPDDQSLLLGIISSPALWWIMTESYLSLSLFSNVTEEDFVSYYVLSGLSNQEFLKENLSENKFIIIQEELQTCTVIKLAENTIERL